MPQPPDRRQIARVLDRAEAILGDEGAEQLARWLAEDWRQAGELAEQPGSQAVWAAAQQLLRAAQLRAAGQISAANMCDHLAEACALGWRQELIVQGTELPDSWADD